MRAGAGKREEGPSPPSPPSPPNVLCNAGGGGDWRSCSDDMLLHEEFDGEGKGGLRTAIVMLFLRPAARAPHLISSRLVSGLSPFPCII